MDGRHGQVGALDLPDLDRLEPVVRFVAAVVGVVTFGLGDDVVLEEGSMPGKKIYIYVMPDVKQSKVFYQISKNQDFTRFFPTLLLTVLIAKSEKKVSGAHDVKLT